MPRPPAFPPSAPRPRPKELEEQLRHLQPPPEARAGVSTRLRERLAELKGARRRAARRKVAALAGAGAGVAAAAWVVLYSPLLALDLEEVTVAGTNEYVTAAHVRAAAAPYAGTPLARLNTEELAGGLAADLPVRTATITREWPAGLRIDLQARTPVAAAPVGEAFALLDGDGVELARVEEVAGLPVVEVGTDGEEVPATIAAVLDVMDALPGALLERVSSVGAKNPHEVEFTLEGGAKVIWGSPAESDLKASVLGILLEVPARVYNVSAPLSPITS